MVGGRWVQGNNMINHTTEITVGQIVQYGAYFDWVVEEIDESFKVPLVVLRRGYGGFQPEICVPITALGAVVKRKDQ